MTETITLTKTTSETGTLRHPSEVLMNLIVALLAPMFLGASGGDIDFARLAAMETVNAYRARNQADLVAVAQIIGFGLAVLGSLSLSMADDISLSMTLRLRGNANALNRSAEQNRRALRDNRGDSATPARAAVMPKPVQALNDTPEVAGAAPPQAAVRATAAAKPVAQPASPAPAIAPRAATAPTKKDQQNRALWAAAMTDAAGKFTASLATLRPAERKKASIRAAALNSTANALLCGVEISPLKPGALAAIMRPTAI